MDKEVIGALKYKMGNFPRLSAERWIESDCDAHLNALTQKGNKEDKIIIEICPENKMLLHLIPIFATATLKSMKNFTFKKLILFDKLLPSLTRTLVCEFRYVLMLGFDSGDPFLLR